MSDNLTVERVDLQKKDKSELQTIVTALGGKTAARATKADLINNILELSGVTESGGTSQGNADEEPAVAAAAAPKPAEGASAVSDAAPSPAESAQSAPKSGARRRRGKGGEPPAEWETEIQNGGRHGADESRAKEADRDAEPKAAAGDGAGSGRGGGRQNQRDQADRSDKSGQKNGGRIDSNRGGGQKNAGSGENSGGQDDSSRDENIQGEDAESANRRRRRRGRGRDRDDEQLATLEPITAAGYLDLREDGYGFLRVNGYLQSADDVYVPVKMARQYGLRKGDLVEGTARPANRNEKNPALQSITSVNGADPEASKSRVRFEDLTPVYPFERLSLEMLDVPMASAARLVDLVAPIGKGQRCLIIAPPEAGSSELIKQIAVAIEHNNPEAHLMVLQFDGRPEEVVTIEQALEHAEVGAATFDAPPEEQVALADFTIERAKRMVEAGEDVVIIADGLTAIARAYGLGTPATGRTITGVDASALHPTKRFFGSARKLEEAGSLTILATITVGTGAVFDEALFDEFRGTATSELHLDAWLADEGVFPNIDLELSHTRSADLLVDPDDLEAIDTLRKLMAAAVEEADDGPAVDAARRLVERVESTKSNAQLLKEISNATTL